MINTTGRIDDYFRGESDDGLELSAALDILRYVHNIWHSVVMNDPTRREPIYDPQELERQMVIRENAGDVNGMTALFEPDAVIELNDGRLLRGKEAIREFFTKLQVTGLGPEGRRFRLGEQRPALICGDLALTSTRSLDGNITTEVARRQDDGTWLWAIDRWGNQEPGNSK